MPRRTKGYNFLIASVCSSFLFAGCASTNSSDASGSATATRVPHLSRKGPATQLIVDGRPFVMLAGELHNSSASSLNYMEPMWEKLVALNLNTVPATVSWELVEPHEGKFDFSLVDGLIEGAGAHDLKLVFLWFASWKNAWSTYVPEWIKKDLDRFPRAQDKAGRNTGAITPLSAEAMKADARAFTALMRRIRKIGEGRYTVLMMQIENETGILGNSRDFSPLADKLFAGSGAARPYSTFLRIICRGAPETWKLPWG
jgi:hypothetical protein